MARNRYSEEEAVQKPAGELLNKLGWELVYAYDDEVLGAHGTLGRKSYREVILKERLIAKVVEFNEWLEEDDCAKAIEQLSEVLTTDSLLQTNEKMYELLRDGLPVERTLPDGTKQTEHAVVFDFEAPEANDFLAVEEFKIDGALHHRRADLVGFVNGLPLMFVEFKRHDKDVRRAYEDNYTDYQDTIPQIFYYNAFVILSNGLEAKVGTLGSSYEFFGEWKRFEEGEEGSVALETLLRGMCNKRTFMDLFENYILFDHSSSPTAKILARNHQFLGVNEAIKSYAGRRLNDGKLGVFWHTQGSGKSYSMVFFARKVRRKFEGSPTFLVVTDRDELNSQIAGTFANCGCMPAADAEKYIATSGKDLAERLQGNPSFVFTLIQKFNDDNPEPLYPAHDVVILSDEAHRTNNGYFAANMCKLLPTASRLGFTGTPLLKYDNLTARTFGGYVSIYDFATAVADGATVPLYYENRSDLLHIENPEINDELAEAVEAANLDEPQTDKLERDLSREYHVITSSKRLNIIAKDFVEHYSDLWQSGKAMFISIDKITAARMYDLVQKYWAQEIERLEGTLGSCESDQEALELKKKIVWMRETEMAVVVSQEQNEIAKFAKWGIDIKTHREKMETRELDKEFKDRKSPLRIVFVCAMWLTGFDVKSLSVMYFDKPMKDQSLMQAIARANRVSQGKSNGLIVDYIGVVKALRQALADYTAGGNGGGTTPVIDKGELLERIYELQASIEAFLEERGFELESLLLAEGFERLNLVKAAADTVSAGDENRKLFGIMARELFKLYKFVGRGDLGADMWARRDAVDAIYKQITKRRDVADTGDIMVELQKIIDEHIKVEEVQDKGTVRFDISQIDFDLLRTEFAKTQDKNLLIGDLRGVINARLEAALRDNPARADFFKRYESIIDKYNKEQDRATIEATFEELMKLSRDLDDEQQRYVREGFTNEQQLAVYDLIYKESLSKSEIQQLKNMCIELVEVVQKRISEMNRWTEKPETRATVNNIIRDELYKLLPTSYPDEVIPQYREAVFGYFYDMAA